MTEIYHLKLPMPTSVNSSHAVGRNRKGGHIIRSTDYKNWLEFARVAYCNAFPGGAAKLSGRLRVDYDFYFNKKQMPISDIDNRIKVCQDFLQHKFFENDNQIDELHAWRHSSPTAESYVMICISKVQPTTEGKN